MKKFVFCLFVFFTFNGNIGVNELFSIKNSIFNLLFKLKLLIEKL